MIPKIFFVEGNIGAGKSTLIEWLRQNVPDSQVIEEPLDRWLALRDSQGKNILERFYESPSKYGFAFQSRACVSRAAFIRSIDRSKRFIFVERSIESDRRVFAQNSFEMGHINDMEMCVYRDLYQDMKTTIETCWPQWLREAIDNATTVYLRCSPETAHHRINVRKREEEAKVPLSYIRSVHQKHEEWLVDGADSLNHEVVVINVDKNVVVSGERSASKKFIPGIEFSNRCLC